MGKLHEVVAVVKERRRDGDQAMTDAMRALQQQDAFIGMMRTYEPIDDDGERLPAEAAQVRATVGMVLDRAQDDFCKMIDAVATQDLGNTQARADVICGDAVILSDVPATFLLYGERMAKNIITMVEAIPILDPSVRWDSDDATGLYRSAEPVERARTIKDDVPVVLHGPTDRHPAQTQLVKKDVRVGTYTEVRYSGAMSYEDRRKILDRAKMLHEGFKSARERANSIEVEPVSMGKEIWEYVFGV